MYSRVYNVPRSAHHWIEPLQQMNITLPHIHFLMDLHEHYLVTICGGYALYSYVFTEYRIDELCVSATSCPTNIASDMKFAYVFMLLCMSLACLFKVKIVAGADWFKFNDNFSATWVLSRHPGLCIRSAVRLHVLHSFIMWTWS